ncbi:MAG: Hsp20/alpha crystallin family protein [Deltaproteobacteria bacterium]|nr:Hsp20/alpha crystallin family protein [Deltaproteobacteria bacterium]
MSPTKWNPFLDLLFLQGRMGRAFDASFLKFKDAGAYFPPVDIYETQESIVLKAEVPGIEINGIDIGVDGNVLTLKGERRPSRNLSEENFHRMERFYGPFVRVFNLPNIVDKSGIKASLKDGVLKIVVPKLSASAPETVKVRVQ